MRTSFGWEKKAGMVHSVRGWTRGVQVKLRKRAIPERLRGVFTTRGYTNPRLPLPLPLPNAYPKWAVGDVWTKTMVDGWTIDFFDVLQPGGSHAVVRLDLGSYTHTHCLLVISLMQIAQNLCVADFCTTSAAKWHHVI